MPAGALVLALVASACALAWQPDSPLVPLDGGNVPGTAPLFLVLLIAAFAAYLAGLLLIRRNAPSGRAVVVLAAAIQLVPLAAPLLLSTDAWTYWSYGWIGSSGGGNPYVDTPERFPANPALPYMGTDWLDTTSVYGPAFTIASEPVAAVSGGSFPAEIWRLMMEQTIGLRPVRDFPDPTAYPVYQTFRRGPLALSYDPYYVAPTTTDTTATTTAPAKTTPAPAAAKPAPAAGTTTPTPKQP